MKRYKNIILGLVFILTLAVIGGNAMFNSSQVTNVNACTGSHWGGWVDITECVANSSCGTTEGTKTQERVCLPGGCGYVCNLAHQECGKGCPEVTWGKEKKECPIENSAYTSRDSSRPCSRFYDVPGDGNPHKVWRYADKIVTDSFGPITFTYDKSADPNKCHRPTGSSLGVPSWAISSYNTENPEWKFAVDINCHEVPAEKETQIVTCEVPYIECDPGTSPTPTPTDEPEPTPTSVPSNGGTGGPGDGLSDGRSDGLSSCPECTQAPGVGGGEVLGVSTGPTKAVLGLSTTSGENELIKLAQVFGSFVLSMFGLAFYKKSA